jgi:hypothetical protein
MKEKADYAWVKNKPKKNNAGRGERRLAHLDRRDNARHVRTCKVNAGRGFAIA